MFRFIPILVVLVIAISASYTHAQSTAGIIMHLPMNSNMQDASGNNYHGNMVAPAIPAPDATGTPGLAMYFDGNSSYTFNNPAKLLRPFTEMTIMVKLCPDGAPFNPNPLLGPPFPNLYSFFCWYRSIDLGWTTQPYDYHEVNLLYAVGNNRENYGLMDFNGQPDCATNPGNYGHFFKKDSVRIVKKWFAFTWVFKNGKVKLYYNCDLMMEYNYYDPLTLTVEPFYACSEDTAKPIQLVLGKDTHDPYHMFGVNNYKGFMDDFRLYGRALDSTEIATYATGFHCGPDVIPRIKATKLPCTNNAFEIIDDSQTYGIPIVSREWTIIRDNYTTNAASFNYTFNGTGQMNVRLKLIDAEGLPHTLDTFIFVSTNDRPRNLIKTDRKDYYLCPSQSSVQAKLTGGVTYNWMPCIDLNRCDSGTVTITPTADQRVYTVAGRTSQGCADTLTITVKKSFDSSDIYMPTAFSPNGDGVNEVFGVTQSPNLPSDFLLEVYNRWGAVVFKTKDPALGWTGTLNNKPQPTGVYIWRVRYSGGAGCGVIQKKGTVVLMR